MVFCSLEVLLARYLMHIGAQIGCTTFSADRLLMPKKRFLFLCEGLYSMLIKNPTAGWELELLSYISS